MSNETDGTTDAESSGEIEPSPGALADHAGIAEDFSDLNDRMKAWHAYNWIDEHRDVLSVRKTEILYAYDNGVWKDDGESKLRTLAQKLLGPSYGRNVLSELKDRVHGMSAVEHDTLGLEPGVLAVENGLLNLETRKIRDLRPDDYALTRLPIEYDPDAECPRWEQFVSDVAPVDRQDTLQEFVGYCLDVGEIRYKKALMLVGDTDSGKSTFLNRIRKLLGEDDVPAESLQDLCNTRWATAQLHGAPANISSELSEQGVRNGAKFKQFTGGDVVKAEDKGDPLFHFKQTAKLAFATNRIPRFESDDLAFYRRWLLVQFRETIPKDEQDRDLGDKLDAELPGILNWALDGHERLHEQDGFSDDRSPEDTRRTWRMWSEPLTEFIELHVHGSSGNVVAASTLHEAYSNFMETRDTIGEVYGQKKLTRKLNKHTGFNYGRYRNSDRNQVRGYRGIKIVE